MKPDNYEEALVNKIENVCVTLNKDYTYDDISIALLAASFKRLMETGGPVLAAGQLLKLLNMIPQLNVEKVTGQTIN